VASNVRPFSESIKEGQGFLCKDKLEWYENLKKLIESSSLRREVGEAAYKRVKKDFNMNDWAKIYAKTLKEIRG
jgi:glycosyltransferase involved in cell wall biosynthesis